MTETIVYERYEHHFEETENGIRYKYSIDLDYGEIVTTKLPLEVKEEIKTSQEVAHIHNLF